MKLSRSCTGRWRTLLVSCCAIGAAIGGARAEEQSAPKLPVCDKKIGTLAVVEPKDTTWWHARRSASSRRRRADRWHQSQEQDRRRGADSDGRALDRTGVAAGRSLEENGSGLDGWRRRGLLQRVRRWRSEQLRQ